MTPSPAEIRAIRKGLGLTQTDLARVMGLRQSTVSDWERGFKTPAQTTIKLLLAYSHGYRPSDWPDEK